MTPFKIGFPCGTSVVELMKVDMEGLVEECSGLPPLQYSMNYTGFVVNVLSIDVFLIKQQVS